jgi:hypothetical protein
MRTHKNVLFKIRVNSYKSACPVKYLPRLPCEMGSLFLWGNFGRWYWGEAYLTWTQPRFTGSPGSILEYLIFKMLPLFLPSVLSVYPNSISPIWTWNIGGVPFLHADMGIKRIDLGRGDTQLMKSLRSGVIPVAIGSVELHPIKRKLRTVLYRGWYRLRDYVYRSPLGGKPLRMYRRLRNYILHS